MATDGQSVSVSTFSQGIVKGLGKFTYGHYLDYL